MKKLVLTSSTIFMVSICLLFACTMNEDVEVKKPQVENLMMPKEYAEIGEKHNEGLEAAFKVPPSTKTFRPNRPDSQQKRMPFRDEQRT